MQRQFEHVFLESSDGVVIAATGGRILRANPAACAALGRGETELQHAELLELFEPSDALHAIFARRDDGETVRGEATFRRGDGSTFPGEFSSGIIRDDGEHHTYAIFRNISHRQTLARELAQSEARYRGFFDQLLEAAAQVAAGVDTNGTRTWTIVNANVAMHRLVRRDSLIGVSVRDAIGALVEERAPVFERVLETGDPVETDAFAPGGRPIRLRVYRQTPTLICVVLLDLTAQREAEREAQAHLRVALDSADELRTILDAVPAGIFLVRDDEDRRIQINRVAARLLRLPGDRSLSEVTDVVALRDHLRPMRGGLTSPEREGSLLRAARDGVTIEGDEVDIVFDDGAVVHLLGNARPLFDGDGTPRGAVAAYADVTAHMANERALAAAVAQFDAFMGASPALHWIKDAEGRLLYANTAWERSAGVTLEQARGRTVAELLPQMDDRLVREDETQVLSSGVPSERLMHSNGLPSGVVQWWKIVRFPITAADGSRVLGGIGTDVTEQKLAEDALRASEATARAALQELKLALEETRRTEEKLRQSQKMQAIGHLAGGVAHDFNNLLTVILGNGEVLAEGLRDDPLLPALEEILKAGTRAATLTRQLLAFSRKQALEPRLLNINTILMSLQTMFGRLLGEDIDLAFVLHKEPHLCLVDPGQIEQVVLNLVVNARDAMPNGGRITIETANVTLDDAYAAMHPEATVGPHVLLSVSDNGVGMSREIQSHLFEPFFTTKSAGRGTGLGLATVYGIVKQSGGSIWVYSEPDHGTTLKVYLPQARGAEDALPVKPIHEGRHRGSETVLLAEDDVQVRKTVSAMLRRNGYYVIEASNGGEALLICEQHGGTISLLITDVVMPRMNGRQLAERLRSIRPDLLVLFISGYTENVVVHHGVVDSGVNFLQKPLTSETLLPTVRRLLDHSKVSRSTFDA